jgi:hypothetical protein
LAAANPAFRASTRLVYQTFLLEESLLTGGKQKFISTFAADQLLVFKVH